MWRLRNLKHVVPWLNLFMICWPSSICANNEAVRPLDINPIEVSRTSVSIFHIIKYIAGKLRSNSLADRLITKTTWSNKYFCLFTVSYWKPRNLLHALIRWIPLKREKFVSLLNFNVFLVVQIRGKNTNLKSLLRNTSCNFNKKDSWMI